MTGQSIYKFTPDGTRSIFVGPEAFTNSETGPIGLAFDHFGNLFVSTAVFPYNRDGILKFTPRGGKSTFVSGLPNPRDLIFDSAGKLFAAENPPSASGEIVKFARDGVPIVLLRNLAFRKKMVVRNTWRSNPELSDKNEPVPGSTPAVILLQWKTKTNLDKTMDGKKLAAGNYIMSVVSEGKTASILITIK